MKKDKAVHNSLTHINELGQASMVDVSAKKILNRKAIAQGDFVAQENTLDVLLQGELPKGEGLAVARIAGIQAGKQCSQLIPLCHPLLINCIDVSFDRISKERLQIRAAVTVQSKTGVEMEALTAVSVAALTLWDMTKAIDSNLSIENIKLVEKLKTPLNEDS